MAHRLNHGIFLLIFHWCLALGFQNRYIESTMSQVRQDSALSRMAAAELSKPMLFLQFSLYCCFMFRFTQLIEYSARLKDFV